MKKSDYYGKFILRYGDLLPEEIDDFIWKDARLSIKTCRYLKSKGLLFDDKEQAMSRYRCIMGSMKLPVENIEEKKRPRIYLSGPISDKDYAERFKAFEEKEAMFNEMGFKVFNPMKNGLVPDSKTHQHMRRDLSVLTNEEKPISHIFMMDKWTHSAGCWKEFETAVSCGIIVIFEEMSLSKGVNSVGKYCGVKFE